MHTSFRSQWPHPSFSACTLITLKHPNRFYFHTLLKWFRPKLGFHMPQWIHRKLHQASFELPEASAFHRNADRPLSKVTWVEVRIINMRRDSWTEDGQIVTQLLQKQQDKLWKNKKFKKKGEKELNEMDMSWKHLCSPQSKMHIQQPVYGFFRGCE